MCQPGQHQVDVLPTHAGVQPGEFGSLCPELPEALIPSGRADTEVVAIFAHVGEVVRQHPHQSVCRHVGDRPTCVVTCPRDLIEHHRVVILGTTVPPRSP